MSDDISIRFAADIADLLTGTAAAASALSDAADAISAGSAASGEKAARQARRLSDQEIQIAEQTALKELAIEEDKDSHLYAMGDESLETFRAQATDLENQKYTIRLAALQKKAAADANDKVAYAKDLASEKLLYQDHVLALQKIDEDYASKKRGLEQQELSDYLSAQSAKLSDGLAALTNEYTTHQISAEQRFAIEQQLTQEIYGEDLKRLNDLIATLTQGTKAYEDAIKQREKLEQEFTKQSETNTNQLTTEEAAKWTTLGNSIKSSFNSALDGMIFQGKTFSQFMVSVAQGVLKAFLEMGEKILEDQIQTWITDQLTTKAVAGVTALGQITDNAAVAASGAYAATAMIPFVGPELAPAAAATAFGGAMSWAGALASLDVGAWELRGDMPAMLHKGEMVVPENFASGLRGNGGIGAGSDVALHYAPTINSREPATLGQMLSTHGHEMHAWIRREFRNGALRV